MVKCETDSLATTYALRLVGWQEEQLIKIDKLNFMGLPSLYSWYTCFCIKRLLSKKNLCNQKTKSDVSYRIYCQF